MHNSKLCKRTGSNIRIIFPCKIYWMSVMYDRVQEKHYHPGNTMYKKYGGKSYARKLPAIILTLAEDISNLTL